MLDDTQSHALARRPMPAGLLVEACRLAGDALTHDNEIKGDAARHPGVRLLLDWWNSAAPPRMAQAVGFEVYLGMDSELPDPDDYPDHRQSLRAAIAGAETWRWWSSPDMLGGDPDQPETTRGTMLDQRSEAEVTPDCVVVFYRAFEDDSGDMLSVAGTWCMSVGIHDEDRPRWIADSALRGLAWMEKMADMDPWRRSAWNAVLERAVHGVG